MNEDDVVGQWIYSTLVSDATLAAITPGGIHEGMAGEDVVTPYIVYNLVSANDYMVIGGIRVWTDMLWDVMAVSQGNDTRVLRPVSDRIDELLHRASGSIVGGVVLTCTREGVIRRGPVKESNGNLYLYRTSEFRAKARKA